MVRSSSTSGINIFWSGWGLKLDSAILKSNEFGISGGAVRKFDWSNLKVPPLYISHEWNRLFEWASFIWSPLWSAKYNKYFPSLLFIHVGFLIIEGPWIFWPSSEEISGLIIGPLLYFLS